MSPTLEHSDVVTDRGAETASRYRFQYTWAAITCCALFDETRDIEEVYCEHHEDILIKHTDGRFSGHQVKSRAANQPPWKANDSQIRIALQKFVRLDHEFPQVFRSFCFLTNHPLYVADTSTSLGNILKCVAQAEASHQLPNPIKRWVGRLARDAGTSEVAAFQTLKKTTADSSLPKLSDAMMRLMNTLADCWAPASECSVSEVHKAARGLVDECARASALDDRQLLRGYLPAFPHPESDRQARIDAKRMTRERIERALQAGLISTAPLTGPPELYPEPGQGRTDLLRAKLGEGGLSIVAFNSAADLRAKADYLAIATMKKLGRIRGLQRYDHMRSLVLSDASHAYEDTRNASSSFGAQMRANLRRRFRARRASNDQLYDYSDEHMEGIAYSLTAQCKVLWSIDRPWEAHD